ncbi:MAG TPA: prolyl oligopeptidase family serine peptidase [Thermoanaerobaculia bacterium]|nr:prolyl oligopeptidase family serine peptidase [Thermoanaerobaculia bacterium]
MALRGWAETSLPATRKEPVVDRYHGVEVVDEYRWLESWDDPAVKAWSEAQNAYARSVLDRLPDVEEIRKQVTAIRKIEIPRYGNLKYAGGRLFALKTEPPKQQPFLVVMPSEDAASSARVVVDPAKIDPQGGTSVDWYVPSPDGARVAVSLSKGGSEQGDVHVYETGTGAEAGEAIHRVNYGTAGGGLAWDPEGRGFFYTRYPREGERPPADLIAYVQVYYHRLRTPETADRYEIGKDFPRLGEVRLRSSLDGRYILASVQNGDSDEFEQHLRTPGGRWLRLTHFGDKIVDTLFGPGDSLYLYSRAGAPRGKMLKVSLQSVARRGHLDLAGAKVVLPESDAVVEDVGVTKTRLFVVEGIGGPHRVRIFDLAGKPVGTVPLPPASAVSQTLTLEDRDAVLYLTNSYTEGPSWYRWTPAGAVKTALSIPFPVDLSDVEVVRDWATSKDGTRIPMTILHRKGLKLDGNNPVLLTGYGGYGISQKPTFNPGLRLWLDRGGVRVIANLRGGNEFGEEWHKAGNLTHKQNVFDDFIACAEHLIQAGYTNKNRLAIEGGSNGGLLMGAVLTQRPDLFKAVVSHVGIYDMLRVELDSNGAFNVPEVGSVKNPEQFKALLGYSPYHHVRDGAGYPAVLLMTGANDPRVNPMHSRKFAARLQSAGAPTVLLRTSSTSGHGAGTRLDERIEQEVDVLAFLFDQLQMVP